MHKHTHVCTCMDMHTYMHACPCMYMYITCMHTVEAVWPSALHQPIFSNSKETSNMVIIAITLTGKRKSNIVHARRTHTHTHANTHKAQERVLINNGLLGDLYFSWLCKKRTQFKKKCRLLLRDCVECGNATNHKK